MAGSGGASRAGEDASSGRGSPKVSNSNECESEASESGLSGSSSMPAISLRDPHNGRRAKQIGGGVDIEEPPGHGETGRMRDFPGLDQQLGRKYRERLPERGRRGLEGRIAAAVAAAEFAFEHRQRASGQNHRKGLRKAIDRRQSDRQARDARVVKQIQKQRGGQKREVDGQKDSAGCLGGCLVG